MEDLHRSFKYLNTSYLKRIVLINNGSIASTRWTRAFNLCVNAIIGKTKTDAHQSTKLLNQGFLRNPLILSFKQVLASYFVSCVQMSKDGIGNYILV
jgi:hypothetical protein